jgi:hypothetical protein
VTTVKTPHGAKLAQMMKDGKDPSDKTVPTKKTPVKSPRKKGLLHRLKPVFGL